MSASDYDYNDTSTAYTGTVRDRPRFFDQVGYKTMYGNLVEISIFSLNHVIVRPTKIIKDLCKAST